MVQIAARAGSSSFVIKNFTGEIWRANVSLHCRLLNGLEYPWNNKLNTRKKSEQINRLKI